MNKLFRKRYVLAGFRVSKKLLKYILQDERKEEKKELKYCIN